MITSFDSIENDLIKINRAIESIVLKNHITITGFIEDLKHDQIRMKNSINLQISPLKLQEINELVNLSFDIWKKTYPGIISYAQIITMLNSRYSYQGIKNDIKKNKSIWLIAKKNYILGFCNYVPMDISCNEIKIDKLYVNPIHQRSGIATKLLNAVIESNKK